MANYTLVKQRISVKAILHLQRIPSICCQLILDLVTDTLRKKCPNTELFLVRVSKTSKICLFGHPTGRATF